MSTETAHPTRAYVFWGFLTSREQRQAESLVQNLKLTVLSSEEIEGDSLSHDEKNIFLDEPEPLLILAKYYNVGPKKREWWLRNINDHPERYSADARETISGFPGNFFGLLIGTGILEKKSFLPRIGKLRQDDPDNVLLQEIEARFENIADVG